MLKPQLLPPVSRTPVWRSISIAADAGEFILQVCRHCQSIQYPPRELCRHCLQDELEWQRVSARGSLVSHTTLHTSTNAFFRELCPLQVGLVKLECGPILFAHLANMAALTGEVVTVVNRRDLSGAGVFIALCDAVDEQAQWKVLNKMLSRDYQGRSE